MLRRFYARVRELDDFKADAILAGAFAIAGVIESLFVNTHGHSRPLSAIVAAVFSAPLAWRRRNTLFALLGFMLILVAQSPLDTFVVQSLTTPWVGVMLLVYTAGRYEPSRRMWIELALAALIINVSSVFQGDFSAGNLFWTVIVIGAPTLAGRAIRSRVLLQHEMRDKAHRLETERHVRAQRAVEDERARIASELQAVVANGVSAMVVQAGAVPRLIENGDSGRAGEALAVIEETGRDALTEMRRLLGVLRRDEDGPALAPQPTLARADALVARIRNEGLDADLTVQGQPTPLSPGVDLAGYRVLQEALASARGADGVSHADVAIVYGEDDVTLTVRDDRESRDGPDAAALRALRERVGLYGGALRVVPRADAGVSRWRRGFRSGDRRDQAAQAAQRPRLAAPGPGAHGPGHSRHLGRRADQDTSPRPAGAQPAGGRADGPVAPLAPAPGSRAGGRLAAGAAVLLAVLTSPNDISSLLLVVILAAYSAGAHLELRPALLGLALVAGAVSAVCLVSTPQRRHLPCHVLRHLALVRRPRDPQPDPACA